MADLKPLTLAPPEALEPGTIQQLQPGDDLDIPLADRVTRLECANRTLIEFLVGMGLDLPPQLLAEL